MTSWFLHSLHANDCRFFDIHFSFAPFDNLSNSCYRNVTFPVSRRISCRSLFFSFRRKIDGKAPLTKVLRPTPKETLISLPGNEIHKYLLFSKESAPPSLLYWIIVFFQILKRATFSEYLKNAMPDFSLSYEALVYPRIYPRAKHSSISQSHHS